MSLWVWFRSVLGPVLQPTACHIFILDLLWCLALGLNCHDSYQSEVIKFTEKSGEGSPCHL